MARLPAVLGTDDLPLAELYAARLDGDLIQLHGAFVPVDEPDLPSLRALIAAHEVDPAFILDRWTAAWVHGAIPLPPPTRELCVANTARGAVHPSAGRIREIAMTPTDQVLIAGVRCLSFERTAIELLRDVTASDETVVEAVAALFAASPTLEGRVRTRVVEWHRLPHKLRVLRRLEAASERAVQPSETR